MTNKEFLHWIANRLVNVYKEHPNTDFVLKLKEIADDQISNATLAKRIAELEYENSKLRLKQQKLRQ
jgi:hypothetical protein